MHAVSFFRASFFHFCSFFSSIDLSVSCRVHVCWSHMCGNWAMEKRKGAMPIEHWMEIGSLESMFAFAGICGCPFAPPFTFIVMVRVWIRSVHICTYYSPNLSKSSHMFITHNNGTRKTNVNICLGVFRWRHDFAWSKRNIWIFGEWMCSEVQRSFVLKCYQQLKHDFHNDIQKGSDQPRILSMILASWCIRCIDLQLIIWICYQMLTFSII